MVVYCDRIYLGRILSRCVGTWLLGQGGRETQLSDSPATTPLSYLTENLASMSFSRAIIGAVKGPTVASSGKTDLSPDLTEIRERPGGVLSVWEVVTGEGEG